jgi:hypothetical protein
MRDKWYGDNRDLVKWSVLFRLAEMYQGTRILQLAFYQQSEFPRITIDGREYDIPKEVAAHFRKIQNITSIKSTIPVSVFDEIILDRAAYLKSALEFLSTFKELRHVVFLDPDIGLEPLRFGPEHVLDSETRTIWNALRTGDLFAFYQHKTNRSGQPWIEPKQAQLAKAIGLCPDAIKIARSESIAADVIILFTPKV